MRAVKCLMNVAEKHAARFAAVFCEDGVQVVRISQSHAVEPRAADRQWLVVHTDQNVLTRGRREFVVEALDLMVGEPARVVARHVAADQHQPPVPERGSATQLQRRCVQHLRGHDRILMVARRAVHRNPVYAHEREEALVGRSAAVVGDVAGDHNGVHRSGRTGECPRERCAKRRVRVHAVEFARLVGEQVRVAQVQQMDGAGAAHGALHRTPHSLRRRRSASVILTCIAQCPPASCAVRRAARGSMP